MQTFTADIPIFIWFDYFFIKKLKFLESKKNVKCKTQLIYSLDSKLFGN